MYQQKHLGESFVTQAKGHLGCGSQNDTQHISRMLGGNIKVSKKRLFHYD
jgi:hypothetical protein